MTVIADEARCAVWAEEAAERVWQLSASSITGLCATSSRHARCRGPSSRRISMRDSRSARRSPSARAVVGAAPHPGSRRAAHGASRSTRSAARGDRALASLDTRLDHAIQSLSDEGDFSIGTRPVGRVGRAPPQAMPSVGALSKRRAAIARLTIGSAHLGVCPRSVPGPQALPASATRRVEHEYDSQAHAIARRAVPSSPIVEEAELDQLADGTSSS